MVVWEGGGDLISMVLSLWRPGLGGCGGRLGGGVVQGGRGDRVERGGS